MAITQKTMKILWAASAGRCSFSGCLERLCFADSREFAPYTIGEMAHICGENLGSNRHDPEQSPEERDGFANLILLCPNHHTLIDRKENEVTYSAEFLRQMKSDHEAFVRGRLEAWVPKDKGGAAATIAPLLAENHEIWLRYGPLSDLARKNSHSESAHAIWVSERLSTIVPNNRLICEILETSKDMFTAEDHAAIAAFLVHARSYERWVENETSYAVVAPFPKSFDDMIKEYANAST